MNRAVSTKHKTAKAHGTQRALSTEPKTATATRARRAVVRRYALRLYVAGMTPRSARAIANIKEICEARLKGLYTLQVIDLYQHPELAEGEQIVALPTLLRKLPPPLQRLVGDLSDGERVLIALDLKPT